MNRGAFNMIELVFVVVILGILTAVAFPRLSISREDACYAKLRSVISETEVVLSKEYTKRFLQGAQMTDADKLTYLKTMEQQNSNGCSFNVNSANSINATIGKKTLTLDIKDDATTKAPVLTCDLNNDLCKMILGRKSSN